ncbi:MAG TPA: divergent PAP2 family protein [Bacilli bacterium]
MPLFANYPLVAAFASILIAQWVKVPLYYITNRSWNLGLCFSSGGMPSSHSAAVVSLSTAIGIWNGVSSVPFAISAVFSAIIMFDAAGVRRHAGEQAVILNRLMEEFYYLFQRTGQEQRKALKELLGHRPIEVFVGALLGACISVFTYILFYR